MSKPIFAKFELPTGPNAVIYEGFGRHYFSAMQKCGGEHTLLIKWLLVELLEVEGKALTEADVNGLHIRDINFAAEVINTMMSNGIPGLRGL